MENKRKVGLVVAVVILIIAAIACAAIISKRNGDVVDVNKDQGNKEQHQEIKKDEFIKVEGDGTRVNTSSKIQNAKFTIDGLEIKNITLTELVGKTDIKADVINNTNETKGDLDLKIKLLDKAGNTIVEIGGYIGTVQPGKTSKINAAATLDYANAYDILIEKR